MSSTETEVETHPAPHLFKVLSAVVHRIGWSSDDQRDQVLNDLREAEGTAAPNADPVVPASTATAVNPVEAAAAAAGVSFDYDKLAQAMVKAQQQQQAQAAAAVDAAPGFETPGSVTAPTDAGHAVADQG